MLHNYKAYRITKRLVSKLLLGKCLPSITTGFITAAQITVGKNMGHYFAIYSIKVNSIVIEKFYDLKFLNECWYPSMGLLGYICKSCSCRQFIMHAHGNEMRMKLISKFNYTYSEYEYLYKTHKIM